jgi:hypothetical protein
MAIIHTKAYESGLSRTSPMYTIKDSLTGNVLHVLHFRKTVNDLLAKYRTQGMQVHATMRDRIGRIVYL